MRERMTGAPNPSLKLYYYSGLYAIAQRLFNLEYDEDLVFMWMVFSTTHAEISQALSSTVLQLEPTVFREMDQALGELVEAVQINGDPYPPLRRLTSLAYSTSGNGRYLREKLGQQI